MTMTATAKSSASVVAARPGDPAITPALIAEHGLTTGEYERLVDMLGRTPTFTELGIVSALWSEHCSYKHSRPLLRTLPTKAPWVLQGPGENAGVISIGDGLAVAFMDVNGDGNLDIYICRSADGNPERRKNLLFINNGDLTFSEKAEQRGCRVHRTSAR